ncbi:B-cell receptor CD22-like [Fundulus heteroclitus]|uniref:B-cell receptor CD22-like n=1 Tax=Fundulus heteroclitus TaxID=8078 RepID=UPI00165AD1E3|nr:B-cell receptor CD22-like [Fundulus heteroclitus]
MLKKMASKEIVVDIEYAPRLPLVSLTPSGEIVEGISLTLTCSSDANPAANYSWFKENNESAQYSRRNFTIPNIGPHHGGLYYCEAHNRRGSHKSAIHFTVVARTTFKIMNFTKLAVIFLLLLILLFVLSLQKRKKKTVVLQAESEEHEENIQVGLDPDYENISALRAFIASQEEAKEKQNNPM